MNSNTINYTTEDKAFIADVQGHSDFEERSINKKSCVASERLEQERRIDDKDGEILRRQNAKLASSFILNANKTSSKVPDFAAVVKEAMLNAGTNISAAATSAKTNTEDLGSKGWSLVRAKASEATAKIQDVNITEPVIDAKIALMNTAVHATQLVVDVSRKGAELTDEVARKGSELSHIGEEKFFETTKKISDTSIVVADHFQRLVKFGDYAFELVADVIKRIAKQFSGFVQTTWSQAIYNANLSYSVNLAEKEKKRRMTSEDESGAILNALAVSSLIKELSPEFYRPTEEPSRAYTFALLEQKEQRSRIVNERLGGNKTGKAREVAGLIKARNQGNDDSEAEIKELLPVFSAEQVIYPDPMQIFEEPRDIAEELSATQIQTKTAERKLHESGTSSTDSPQALRLAM